MPGHPARDRLSLTCPGFPGQVFPNPLSSRFPEHLADNWIGSGKLAAHGPYPALFQAPPLAIVVLPHPADVVCARQRRTVSHSGNVTWVTPLRWMDQTIRQQTAAIDLPGGKPGNQPRPHWIAHWPVPVTACRTSRASAAGITSIRRSVMPSESAPQYDLSGKGPYRRWRYSHPARCEQHPAQDPTARH